MNVTDVPDKRGLLARHHFFGGMSPELLERLAARARLTSEPAGRLLFRKGDQTAGPLAIVSGVVRISVASGRGNEVVLNFVGTNEIFGEVSVLDGGPRIADAITVTRCELLMLDRRDFMGVLNEHSGFAVRLLALVSAKLRRRSEQLADMTFADPQIRLAKALLRLAQIQAIGTAAQPVASITQRALGWTVGLSRESTNKLLRQWGAAGYVDIGKGTCVILNPEALRRVAAADTPPGHLRHGPL
jgi:CRP/FNR family cyclic AMP-dependent transcriptional regulator